MPPRRTSILSALITLVAAGCGGKAIIDTPAEDGGTETSPSTTTEPTTTTESWTGTSTACDADLVAALGASAPCNGCSGSYCCPEAEAFVANASSSTYDALVTCGAGADGAGPCAASCRTSLCDSDLGYFYLQACADCLNIWCCGPFDACWADSSCAGPCLYAFTSSCCANPSFLEWDTCAATSCSIECVGSWCGG